VIKSTNYAHTDSPPISIFQEECVSKGIHPTITFCDHDMWKTIPKGTLTTHIYSQLWNSHSNNIYKSWHSNSSSLYPSLAHFLVHLNWFIFNMPNLSRVPTFFQSVCGVPCIFTRVPKSPQPSHTIFPINQDVFLKFPFQDNPKIYYFHLCKASWSTKLCTHDGATEATHTSLGDGLT